MNKVPIDEQSPDVGARFRVVGWWSALYFIFRYGLPPLQRLATLVFLVQCILGLVAISAVCIIQMAGADVNFYEMPTVARFFSEVYAIDPIATLAKARFNILFPSLALIYSISLSCFAVSIVGNSVKIFRDIRRGWRLLLPTAFLLFGLWVELFVRVPTENRDLQKTIIDGGSFGYIVLFVIFPFAFAIVAAALPFPQRRNLNISRQTM